MSFEHSIRSGSRQLRCGYTTGTCAALAASGAAELLLGGVLPESMALLTPKGWRVETELLDGACDGEIARCAVKKDAGDDPDVTDGMLVYASVTRTRQGISIDGGEGVGRVTKPGLDQPVGAAAINSVPRRMITAAVEAVCAAHSYAGGLAITISIPGGEVRAKQTFNPQLGIEGGLSVLGTSGIVEPMSEQALLDTIALAIRQAAASGADMLLLTPGNYGADYLKDRLPELEKLPAVKFSNFLGDAIDLAISEGFSRALIVGHIGKLVKLAGGIMNTHSRVADCRMELFCAHAALCGADTALCRALMAQVSSDGCLALLEGAGLRDAVMESLLAAMQRHLDRRSGGQIRLGALCFSNEYGFLGMTEGAKELLKR